mgnify:FL=1
MWGKKKNIEDLSSKTQSKQNKAMRLIMLLSVFIVIVSLALIVSRDSLAAPKAVNPDGKSGGSKAMSQKDIEAAVNTYKSYSLVKACVDEFNSYGGDEINQFNSIGSFVHYSSNSSGYGPNPASVTMINYVDGDNKENTCTNDSIQSAAKSAGIDINIADELNTLASSKNSKTVKASDVASLIKDKILSKMKSISSDAALFMVYKDAFTKRCSSGDFYTSTTDPVNKETWKFEHGSTLKANGEGKYDLGTVYIDKNKGGPLDEHRGAPFVSKAQKDSKGETCYSLYDRMNKTFPAYVNAINASVEETGNKAQDQNADSGDGSEGDDEKDKCNAGFFGFGFLLCPGQNLLNLIIDFLYGIIENILDWRLLETSGSQIKSYWEKFLSIANVILVIAFLVIIYSTATSDGLSNYDVKKMLPRIVILAVVINISFYVCAAIVDLCNIAGRGVMALLISTSPGGEGLGLGEKIGTVVSNVATGVAGGIAGVVAGVILFVSIGPPAVLALIVIILALIFRGVALTMMVIISPIAIALYLFPSAAMNKWHVKWRDAFIKMLLVYPMFMAVWGGSKLIASVTASTQNPVIGFITSLICTIAPAVAIIPLFKMSGDVMGKATAAIAGSKLANSAATGIHGAVSKSRPMRHASNIMPNALQAAQNRFGDTPLIGGVLRSDGVNKAISAADKQYNELDKQAMENANDKISRMNGGQLQEAFLNGTVDGNQITDTHTMRAIIAKQAPNATMEQAQQSMQSVNARANWLQEHGREREANELRRSYADAMIENGKSGISATTLNNWADTGWSNNDFDANYSNAISNYVSGMSASAVSSTSAGDMEHIQDTLNHAVARGAGAAAVENARQNLAAQSSAVLNNEDMRSKMSNTSIEVLRENTLLRNNASQATTTRFNLDSAGSNIDRQTRARFLNGAGSVGGYTPRRNRTNSNTPHGTTADRSAPSPDARWDRRR